MRRVMTQRFTIMMRFQTSTKLQEEEVSRLPSFLRELPTILQPLCKRDIQYTICDVQQKEDYPMLLQLTLEVIPNWFQGCSAIEDDEFRRLGIKEPERTRGSIAVNLWLLSLQRYGEGPLQAAWKAWYPEPPTPPCPIMLVQYSIA